jgi:hypothetical protein
MTIKVKYLNIKHFNKLCVITSVLTIMMGCGNVNHSSFLQTMGIEQERRTGHMTVFDPQPDGKWELFWVALDGSKVERLTKPHDQGRSPAWSPDGSRLTLISERDGNGELCG